MSDYNTDGKPTISSFALYKRLFGYLKKYLKMFSISIVAMMISASTEVGFTWLMRPLIDEGFVAKNSQIINLIPLAIVGLFLLRGLTSFINAYTGTYLTTHLVQTMRGELFKKMLSLPTTYFDNNASGRVITRITNDAGAITAAGFNVITVTVKDGVTVIGLVSWLLYLDWQLTLITLFVLPAVAICVRFVVKRLRNLSRKSQTLFGKITQILNESIGSAKIVKIYCGQDFEIKRFDKASDELRRNQIKQSSTSSLNTGVTQLIIATALAVILYLAAQRAQTDNFTAGSFMSFLTAMLLLFGPIKAITGVSQTIQGGLAAAESVFGFLDEESEPDNGQLELTHAKGDIHFRDVSFRYQGANVNALNHVNMTIPAGKTVALVGFSGSGKTTITSLIPRFYLPESGEIFLDGHPLNDYTLASLRASMALVSQEIVLFNDTVHANIAYAKPDASFEEVREAAKAANALEFIEEMPEQFDSLIGENGVKLSGGQRQRIAIARALLKNAPILILDEATSALDTRSERQVQAALDNLMKNRTTLVVAHRLSTIKRADLICVIHEGKIVERGKHDELIALDRHYKRLVDMQSF